MKNIKVTVKHKQELEPAADPTAVAQLDEIKHVIHGYIKKGDNIKVMVDKLQDHGYRTPEGNDWCYESLSQVIKEWHL
jgi:hypothetical protein